MTIGYLACNMLLFGQMGWLRQSSGRSVLLGAVFIMAYSLLVIEQVSKEKKKMYVNYR